MSINGCAVIVDSRPSAALKFVVETALPFIPPDWPIQIFHGTQNEVFVKTHFATQIASGRIILTKMPLAQLTRLMYSNMLLTCQFWEQCLGEHILIFQTDSTFLPTSPHKLTDFLQWDFIGAPWWNREGLNGGFSLRTKSSAIAAIQGMTPEHRRMTLKGNMVEDQYFCKFFKNHPRFRLAPIHEAQKFCLEGVYYEKPMAVHQPWTFKNSVGLDQYYKLVRANPVFQQLLRLNNQPLFEVHRPQHRRSRSTVRRIRSISRPASGRAPMRPVSGRASIRPASGRVSTRHRSKSSVARRRRR
jgi:hypothetical protein